MCVWQAVERFSPFPLYSKVYRRGTRNIPRAGVGLPLLSGRVDEEINLTRFRRYRPWHCFVEILGRPSTAQGFVQLHDRYQVETVCACQRQLGVKQVTLGDQDIQVVGEPALIAQTGQSKG